MERPVCPKCGYTRRAHDPADGSACLHCGIVFAKYAQYLADQAAGLPPLPDVTVRDGIDGWLATLGSYLCAPPARTTALTLGVQSLAQLVLLIWGLSFIAGGWRQADANQSFLHLVDLPFHEFGHVLFIPFGQWMTFLGGSLFQCLVPLMLGVVFVWREHNPFGGSVCLWWLGQNMIDLAPYIGDASTMQLSLIGEWSDEIVESRILRHDWHNILEPLGMLHWDNALAILAHGLGSMLILLSWIWGLYLLWQGRQQFLESKS
ncbi:zinc ribbon domain-containing protein [Chitinimonas arctica]|uniref:Zinc ribbon domain-containing protein n=1 Tax=Chitinimonas arctica TaxID=2594795 RepID=A0A516SJT8_9NEIS|nr:zinc ribbon domain-containing protein [Chitinimonas arctica]QDQ28415.1 zinc ribbon domain-containing protein [Chitinimonas arctica]